MNEISVVIGARPAELESGHELWSRRRQQVLATVDGRAAKHARRLACTCRLLAGSRDAAARGDEQPNAYDAFQEPTTLVSFDDFAPDSWARPGPDSVPLSRRATRTIDVTELMIDSERPTRVVAADTLDDADLLDDPELTDDSDLLDDPDDPPTRVRSIFSFAAGSDR